MKNQIYIAENAGFCYGVDRAMELLYDKMNEGVKVSTYGPIIHNPQVVSDLLEKGVSVLNEEEAPDGGAVVIRTHGVPKVVSEYLRENADELIDATCPYVKKIHKIVEKHYELGYNIVIVGDKTHPEVIGINGWCENKAVIIATPQEAEAVTVAPPFCVVAQTTFRIEAWKKIIEILKNYCTDAVIFDTICHATELRQNSAAKLAEQVDAMMVIGGRGSSNTAKLYEICRQICKQTYYIERLEDLPTDLVGRGIGIGITAGASTPAWIIKEVANIMAEEKEILESAEELRSFAEILEESLLTLNTGDVVEGIVIGFSPTEVSVDLGTKADGYIPVSELTDDPSLAPQDIVKVGDKIKVFVVRVNDIEGTVMLSKKKLDVMKGWEIAEKAFEEQAIVKGKVVDVVNGGIIVLVDGTRVFVPGSLANDRFLSDLSVLKGNEVSLRIIDVNRRKRKIVGSIKSVLVEEKKKASEAIWADIEEGKHYTGTVKSLTNFGAFVDIGGIDGLVHISELSWGHIKHPSEVVKVGDQIDVFVLSADRETKKISLGYKTAENNPWTKAKAQLNVNDVIQCKIVRLVPFGAFAEVMPGIDGLIHISQISNVHIAKPSDALTIGDVVDAKIIEIDWEKQKISLSIREILPEAEKPQKEEKVVEEEETPTFSEEMDVTLGTILPDLGAEE